MSEHVKNPPTRAQVAERLQQLIAGTITPEAASEWASTWVTKFDQIRHLDRKMRDALEALAMADAPTTDRKYLYGCADFEAWLQDLLA